MSIKVSTRKDWGCPVSYNRPIPERLGVSIHYPGPGSFRFTEHSRCLTQVRHWDAMHRARGSAMLEYGGVVCQHGYYIEGRGTWGNLMQQPGSNGSRDANRKYPSIQFMAGTQDAPPSDQEYRWIAEVVARMFAQGLARKVIGHRDTYATDCPGDPIYRNLGKIKNYALNPQDGDLDMDEETLRKIVREEVARFAEHQMTVNKADGKGTEKIPFYRIVTGIYNQAALPMPVSYGPEGSRRDLRFILASTQHRVREITNAVFGTPDVDEGAEPVWVGLGEEADPPKG